MRSSPRPSLGYGALARHGGEVREQTKEGGSVEADLTDAAMVRRCSDVEGGAPGAREAALGDKGAL
jgi:hypothetical protein